MGTVHGIPSNVSLDPTIISHADLLNLPAPADDHTQYLLLAGRTGGQVAIGGDGVADELELQGSSDSAKGTVRVNSPLKWDANFWGTGGQSKSEPALDLTIAVGNTGAAILSVVEIDPTVIIDNAFFLYATINHHGSYQQTVAAGFASFILFSAVPILWSSSATVAPLSSITLNHRVTVRNDGGGGSQPAVPQSTGLNFVPVASAVQDGDKSTLTDAVAVEVQPGYNTQHANAEIEFDTVVGLRLRDPTSIGAVLGTHTIQNYYGLHCSALSLTPGNEIAVVNSLLAASASNYFLKNTGGAQSVHTGNFFLRSIFQRIYFGSSDQASIHDDGTNLIIDPDVVGSGRVYIGLSGDDDMLLNSIEIDGQFDHDGTEVGFYGNVPVVQSAAYTPTNVSSDRSYDADSTTLDEVADVLGTLIADLQAVGLVG